MRRQRKGKSKCRLNLIYIIIYKCMSIFCLVVNATGKYLGSIKDESIVQRSQSTQTEFTRRNTHIGDMIQF